MVDVSSARRSSGLAFVGDLSWGSHFCHFYQTKEDLLHILVPYFRAGLEANEFCLWVTSDFLTAEEALRALEKGVPGFSDYVARGQMEVVPHTGWYLAGGHFDLERTLQMWMEKQSRALARGFSGARVTGAPHWIDNRQDWDTFASYEAELNDGIGNSRLLVLCSYSLEKCGVAEILDVVKNHDFALAMNRGEWQVLKIPSACQAHC